MRKSLAAPIGKSESDYMAEDDHRTLERAEEIRADKKRMAGVRKHHTKKTTALKRMGAAMGRGKSGR